MDILAEYTARIAGDCSLQRPMKIVVDCGNGIAGASAPAILRALGCRSRSCTPRSTATSRTTIPTRASRRTCADLIAAVAAGDAELGLAFDGDGDRLGVVTKDGKNIYPDRQLMLFARDVLRRDPGAPILFDVKCTQHLGPLIRAAGGEPLMWKTGHSLIKAKMKEIGAPLAGEMSGHIFFDERWYGFDDGTYAAARLLEILSRARDPSAVLDALPESFTTPELNVPCAEGEPARVVERLRAEARFPRRPGGRHHRRRARRLPGRLRPDPRLEHDAGAGAALRGRTRRRRWSASRRDCMARAAPRQARRAGRRRAAH